MDPQISLIVPVYNVEEYLPRCLDSIRAQTFENFEVILVDDGSSDGSSEICDTYVKLDDRFSVIHRANGGAGAARNSGIDRACGTYLSFVDGDDYIDPRMIELLYAHALETHADMAVCGIYNVYGTTATPQYEPVERFVCDAEEALGHTLVGQKIPGSMCNRLLRHACIGSLRFPEGIIYEDACFAVQLTGHIKVVAVSTQPLYYYHHRKGSATTATFSTRNLNAIEVYTFAFQEAENRYPSLLPQAMFRLEWAYFTVLDNMLLCNDYRKLPDYPRVRDFLKRHAFDVMRSVYFQTTRKVAAIALLINVGLYRQLLLWSNGRMWRDVP